MAAISMTEYQGILILAFMIALIILGRMTKGRH